MAKRRPSYFLHKPSGRAVVTLNGKDRYLGPYGTPESKQAYEMLMIEYESAGASFGVQATLGTIMLDYLTHCREYYPPGPASEAEQVKYALRYLEPWADLPAKQFTPSKLRAVRDSMLKVEMKNGKKLSRQYINKVTDKFVAMMKWAASHEIVDVQVAQALAMVEPLKRGRTQAREAPPIPPVDCAIAQAAAQCASPTVATMIRLQLLTGFRPGEVCKLTPSMIDRSGEVWVAVLEEHKTAWRGHDRKMLIGPEAQKLLAPYLLRGQDKPLFSPAESVAWHRAQRRLNRTTPENCGNRPGTNCAGTEQPGEAYDTKGYRQAIHRACDKAGVQRFSPNQLKKTTATRIRREHGLEAAQVILGHRHATVTEIYAMADEQRGREVIAQVG